MACHVIAAGECRMALPILSLHKHHHSACASYKGFHTISIYVYYTAKQKNIELLNIWVTIDGSTGEAGADCGLWLSAECLFHS